MPPTFGRISASRGMRHLCPFFPSFAFLSERRRRRSTACSQLRRAGERPAASGCGYCAKAGEKQSRCFIGRGRRKGGLLRLRFRKWDEIPADLAVVSAFAFSLTGTQKRRTLWSIIESKGRAFDPRCQNQKTPAHHGPNHLFLWLPRTALFVFLWRGALLNRLGRANVGEGCGGGCGIRSPRENTSGRCRGLLDPLKGAKGGGPRAIPAGVRHPARGHGRTPRPPLGHVQTSTAL